VRRVLHIGLLAALLLPAAPGARADGASSRAVAPLSLAALTELLRARNPSVAAARRRVEAALIAVPRARALPDPSLTTMVEDISLHGGGMPMVRLQVSQMFPWMGKRDRMAAVAAREADAATARTDLRLLDVVASGKRLYYQLLLNREGHRINREQRAVVDTVVTVATSRLRSGTGMHHDVLKMQTEASMLDDALIMLDADQREMAAMLNALLDLPAGAPVGEPLEAWTPEVTLSRERLTRAAFEHRPELREMSAMERAEEAMAAAARREYYPDVMIGGLYDLRMDQPDAVGAMLGLNLPIWIGSRQHLDVRAAETRARGIERDRTAMAAMTRSEIEGALARIDASTRRSHLLETEFIPRAQQTLDSAIAAFPTGTVDALELLDALRAVSAQRLARTTTRIDRELGLIDLERATGVPLQEMTP
jgi:cobalt-zinc-cadmium efflux system outer membrane protein